jgi:hypothetical protein
MSRYRNIVNLEEGDDAEGAEGYLFSPHRGNCYGYVHLGRTDPDDDDTIRSINLRRLGGTATGNSVRGVHIIWIAARLHEPGICVVGEYRNATVYRTAEPSISRRKWGWNISTSTNDVKMIQDAKRINLPGVPLRQGNLWYANGPKDLNTRRTANAHISRFGIAVT